MLVKNGSAFKKRISCSFFKEQQADKKQKNAKNKSVYIFVSIIQKLWLFSYPVAFIKAYYVTFAHKSFFHSPCGYYFFAQFIVAQSPWGVICSLLVYCENKWSFWTFFLVVGAFVHDYTWKCAEKKLKKGFDL